MGDLADTICALSTTPGRSGIAMVRVSGAMSFSLLHKFFRSGRYPDKAPPRVAMLGYVVDPRDGSRIDQVMATCFPHPNSYTGQDLVEYTLHGSPVLIATLLDALCASGARLADPGEFTMRAYLNGRMDLSQAEAVRDIIDATTLYQAQVALRQHAGEIARQLEPLKRRLIDIIINLESTIEFAEEDLPLASREILLQKMEEVRCELRSWIGSFRKGRIVRDGFSLAIIGRPNVGKSSIFNALLAQDRSIVAEMPGTTRDLISEFTNIEGIPVRLLDTAGIHSSDDSIEKLGIDRSLQAIAEAGEILLVIDTSRPQIPQDSTLKHQLGHLSYILVMNKSDLPSLWSVEQIREYAGNRPYLEVSARTGTGIDALRSAILKGILGDAMHQDGIMVTNLRHCHCLEGAERDLARAIESLREELSEEFVLLDLHAGLKKLGMITGETDVDDLLIEIFSHFCIGK
jgi:tRNA modification GTPase